MIKMLAQLEAKIGDRIYNLLCHSDSPTTEVKEALFQFIAQVADIEKKSAEASAQAAPAVVPSAVEDAPESKIEALNG